MTAFDAAIPSCIHILQYIVLGIVVVILEVSPSSFYFVGSRNNHKLVCIRYCGCIVIALSLFVKLGGHIHDELYTAVIKFDTESEQDDTNLVNKLQREVCIHIVCT